MGEIRTNMLLYHGSNIVVSNSQILESDRRLDFGKSLPYIRQFYNNEVYLPIMNKYGYSIMDSYRKFLFSKTYQINLLSLKPNN